MEKHCACGCGTPVAAQSTWARGHNNKSGTAEAVAALSEPNPSGLCMCGCGGRPALAKQTHVARGLVKGKPFRYLVGHNSKFITGDARSTWKGGRIVTDQGYAKVRVDGRYVYEHRVVLERVLGRPLTAGEQVHHINGDKLDNRPENLELWSRSQPAGVRITAVHCPGCTCPK